MVDRCVSASLCLTSRALGGDRTVVRAPNWPERDQLRVCRKKFALRAPDLLLVDGQSLGRVPAAVERTPR
jgi:hypothetical protein